MGLLIDGVWHDKWYDTDKTGGRFKREDSAFRHWVTADGSAGPSGDAGFKAEPDRYHLYVALACPWCHRVMIMRRLKKLINMVSISIVNSHMGEQGWIFAPGRRKRGLPKHARRTKRPPAVAVLSQPASGLAGWCDDAFFAGAGSPCIAAFA